LEGNDVASRVVAADDCRCCGRCGGAVKRWCSSTSAAARGAVRVVGPLVAGWDVRGLRCPAALCLVQTQDLVVDMPPARREPQDVEGLHQSNYAAVNGCRRHCSPPGPIEEVVGTGPTRPRPGTERVAAARTSGRALPPGIHSRRRPATTKRQDASHRPPFAPQLCTHGTNLGNPACGA
jgi:hypothetical protein